MTRDQTARCAVRPLCTSSTARLGSYEVLVICPPRPFLPQVRNYLMCLGLFVGVAAVWAYYIYVVWGAALFRGRGRPPVADMAAQVRVRDCCLGTVLGSCHVFGVESEQTP